MMEEQKKPDETTGVHMVGHLKIRDKNTGEVLLNQRDDVLIQKHNLGNTDAG